MKLYAALLIDGAEEGPRVPAHLYLAAESSSQSRVDLKLAEPIKVGPAAHRGHGSIGFFSSEDSAYEDDLILEVSFGPIAPGETITYTPG